MLRKMRWRMMMLWKMRWRMIMLSMMMSRGGRWWYWEWWCWGGAVEMRLEISQEPLYTEIYTKNTATPGWAQNADTHTLREPAHANALGDEIYRTNAAPQSELRTQTHTLCEPAQSKCTSTLHKCHFIRKFTGKMPSPSWRNLIKHRPCNYLKNLSVWTHCLGKYRWRNIPKELWIIIITYNIMDKYRHRSRCS